eukprot:CAMPEP_0117447590 /NCGR_PEP_ID=MMETSP0759-20121206/6956_1 /TAXON_ID=63605 /ORGANISM="Percolomonas cosmopolitus, Strain WS" /LENGTH=1112 /DNA_ID=CAMNT_0005239935 /DNA_START=429 /DNA_END=3768 /DNA_ORIENTATION=+
MYPSSDPNNNNNQPFLTPYLQKVSNRNPNSQQQQPHQQAPPLNSGASTSQGGVGTNSNPQPSQKPTSVFSHSSSIWKSTATNDPHGPLPTPSDNSNNVTERPKRATFSSGSGHHRSLSSGAQTRNPFQSRMHYSGGGGSTGARIQQSSSTDPYNAFGSATISYNSAPPSGSSSFSHSHSSSCSESAGEDLEDRMDGLSLGGFSTSPCSSSTNSVAPHSTGSAYGFSRNHIMSFTDYSEPNSYMRIPDHGLSTSPPSYNPHIVGLDSPPKHYSSSGGPLSLNSLIDSTHSTGGSSSSYNQFSTSPSSFSQFSGPWSSQQFSTNQGNAIGGSLFHPPSPQFPQHQGQPIGGNLHLYQNAPGVPPQAMPPNQRPYHHGVGQNLMDVRNPPTMHQQSPTYSQQAHSTYAQHHDLNSSPQGYFSNPVAPRYSTTPSSPTAPRRIRKSHSTPASPSGTPNPSPPKGYNRKPRSLGPSPQKPRPGNARHSGWAGSVTMNGSRTSPSKSTRGKTRPRKREESQGAKQRYKELSRLMKESGNFYDAKELAVHEMNDLPNEVHWRVCMDLADMAKRENLLEDARHWFMQVNKLQPLAAQGWLEFAKLEEECGNVMQCHNLLMKGLQHCQQHESLLIKAVKFFENINKIHCAREILGRLRFMSIEKNWKIFLEGALFESRDGNVKLARDVFKLLMHKVRRHGPIYYEAYKLEEKCEEYVRAIHIVEKGLEENPRYGPLWFSYLHLLEREASHKAIQENKPIDLTAVRQAVEKAVQTISSELVWKVYFEAAHIEERANEIKRARTMYARSVVKCLVNLRWKVWLAGARTELNAGQHQVARDLLNRALKEVPNKTRAQVLIECARLEEYYGNIEKGREFLKRAKQEAKHEWKVFLESILLEMRANNTRQAIKEAEEALEIHRGTGRLWAVLIQLKQCDGPDEQIKIFRQALVEVPKSGEVWCEGARIRLNPLSPKFNLDKARDYLNFAIKFTPQYGDSFIEYLRLELLSKGPRLEEQDKLYLEQLCVNADPNYGPLWFFCKTCPTDSTRSVLRRAKNLLRQELTKYQVPYQRAILRFACKSVSVNIDADSEHSPEDFAMSLQTLTDADDEETRKKRIFGSEQLSA